MNNLNRTIISLSQVCRYLAKLATEKGVEIYSGFAVDDFIYDKAKMEKNKRIFKKVQK